MLQVYIVRRICRTQQSWYIATLCAATKECPFFFFFFLFHAACKSAESALFCLLALFMVSKSFQSSQQVAESTFQRRILDPCFFFFLPERQVSGEMNVRPSKAHSRLFFSRSRQQAVESAFQRRTLGSFPPRITNERLFSRDATLQFFPSRLLEKKDIRHFSLPPCYPLQVGVVRSLPSPLQPSLSLQISARNTGQASSKTASALRLFLPRVL